MSRRIFSVVGPLAVSTLAVVLLVPLARGMAPASSAEPPTGEQIARLVEALSDTDASVREDANKRLAELGPVARDELLNAARTGDPEQAARAEQLLLRLPLPATQGSAAARQILRGYGSADLPGRRAAIQRLVDMREIDAALRVYRHEPNDALRWLIVSRIMQPAGSDEALLERLRQLDTATAVDPAARPTAETPLLALKGWAWMRKASARGWELYEQVVEREAAYPSTDESGVLDDVFGRLITRDIQRHRFEAAAALLRQQVARATSSYEAAEAIAQLFALHAHVGPLKGFTTDLVLYGPTADRPSFTDNVTMFCWYFGALVPPAGALPGHLTASLSPLERIWSADALLHAGLLEAARWDLREALRLPVEPVARMNLHVTAHYRLSQIAANTDDDASAAEHLEAIRAMLSGTDFRLRNFRDEDLQAEIHWRRLRAARAEQDAGKIAEHLDALARLNPTHADIALDVVPLLRERDRDEEADAFFERSYAQLKQKVDAEPDDPEHLNNLAWLCARSGRRLDEAVQLAERALALAPDTAAFLDTAAEAHFASGNAAKAVELETRALELRPNDKFMQEQLARFRAGKK